MIFIFPHLATFQTVLVISTTPKVFLVVKLRHFFPRVANLGWPTPLEIIPRQLYFVPSAKLSTKLASLLLKFRHFRSLCRIGIKLKDLILSAIIDSVRTENCFDANVACACICLSFLSDLSEPAHLIAFTCTILIPPDADPITHSHGSHLGGLAHM